MKKRKRSFQQEELRPKKRSKIKIVTSSETNELQNHPKHKKYFHKSVVHQELALERIKEGPKNLARIAVLKKIIRLEKIKKQIAKKINVYLHCRKGKRTCNIIECATKCIYHGCDDFIKGRFLCNECKHVDRCFARGKHEECDDHDRDMDLASKYIRIGRKCFILKLQTGICKPMFYPGSDNYDEAIYGDPKKWYGVKYAHLKKL